MTNREIIRELKRRGYSRVDIDRTDHAPFFFRRLLAFLKGERKENEIIDEIYTD